VTVGRDLEEAWVRVEDWGKGFDIQQLHTATDHIGMDSLRERADLLDGLLELESLPDKGTSLTLTVPLGMTVGQEGVTHLRARAQALLRKRPSDLVEVALASELDPKEVAALLHEFEIHRIELEIQNQELRSAQFELETTRKSYLDLYEASSTGVLELDCNDHITDANAALCAMVEQSREALLQESLGSLLVCGSAGEDDPQVQKLVRREPPGWFWAKVDKREAFGHKRLVAVTDLTSRREAEQTRSQLQALLELTEGNAILAELVDEISGDSPTWINEEPFSLDGRLGPLLDALSKNLHPQKLSFHLGAQGMEAEVDPRLLAALVQKLIKQAGGSMEPVTVTTGTLSKDGEQFSYVEVADCAQGKHSAGRQKVLLRVKQWVAEFGGRLSVLADENRGTTVRLVLPGRSVRVEGSCKPSP
jgi:PAS domain-containing protein